MRVHRDLEVEDHWTDEPTRVVPPTTEADETVVTDSPRRTSTTTTVVQHGSPAIGLARRKAQQAVWYFFGVLETLLALRFVLLALGANPANAFFAFLTGLTDPLVAPFANLVATPRYNGAVLELGTIFAMVIYLLLAIAITKLLDLLLSSGESY